jgi:hypothetical protein
LIDLDCRTFSLLKIKVFNEKLNFGVGPRVDARNENYRRNGGDVTVFSEKLNFGASPRIDARNENYRKNGGDVKVT